jgi:hypothetical protein
LTTGFCEIRFPKPAPDKASGGIEIEKFIRDPPRRPNGSNCKSPSELYFDGEIHNEGALKAES